MKEKSSMIPEINGSEVKGEAHLQPGSNKWIGVFKVSYDLLKEDIEEWNSMIVKYDGPLKCKDEYVKSAGEGKIIHVRPIQKGVIINIEGTEESTLCGDENDKPNFGYNMNLPPS